MLEFTHRAGLYLPIAARSILTTRNPQLEVDWGRMPHTLSLISPDGPMLSVPDCLSDGPAKDDFATTSHLMCLVHVAIARVMALEQPAGDFGDFGVERTQAGN